MMLKTISIVLPQNMIQDIDEMLLEKDFASRSDFFRHLVRLWFLLERKKLDRNLKLAVGSEADIQKELTPVEALDLKIKAADLEHGIPPDIVKLIEEKAKLLN